MEATSARGIQFVSTAGRFAASRTADVLVAGIRGVPHDCLGKEEKQTFRTSHSYFDYIFAYGNAHTFFLLIADDLLPYNPSED